MPTLGAARGSVAGTVPADRAILSEARQCRPPIGIEDAAHLFPAALVQSIGPGGRRGVVVVGADRLVATAIHLIEFSGDAAVQMLAKGGSYESWALDGSSKACGCAWSKR